MPRFESQVTDQATADLIESFNAAAFGDAYKPVNTPGFDTADMPYFKVIEDQLAGRGSDREMAELVSIVGGLANHDPKDEKTGLLLRVRAMAWVMTQRKQYIAFHHSDACEKALAGAWEAGEELERDE